MTTTNRPQHVIEEPDATAPRRQVGEQGDGTTDDREGADTATRWEDGTAMPYWVAPEDAQGQ